MNDQSLGDHTSAEKPTPATPFGTPGDNQVTSANHDDEVITPPASARQWTIDEILDTARPSERHARICLRGDLEAELTMVRNELLTLVDAQGEVIEDDDERSVGAPSKAARARELADRDVEITTEMAKAMWYPLLRSLTPDALVAFNQKWLPKKDNDDAGWAVYYAQLIAACSVADKHGPKLTVEAATELRSKLGANAYQTLAKAAMTVCQKGGTDFPRSPAAWAHLRE